MDTIYLIHLIGVVYFSELIAKFQAIQEDHSTIRLKLIITEGAMGEAMQPKLGELTKEIRLVMSERWEVIYDFVDDIPLRSSGKHLYTIRRPAVLNEHTRF